jgi:ABC-2 type transport system permease protein
VRRAWVLIKKEWREILAQRGLLFSMLLMPIVFPLLPVVALLVLPEAGPDDRVKLGALADDPRIAGWTAREVAELLIAQQFQVLVVLLPVLIPAVLSAQSVVGEKVRKTLEPLLATPIRTFELVVAKCLAALIPAVLLTWAAGLLFVGGLVLAEVSPNVIRAIVSPSWVLVLVAVAPTLAATAIALTIVIPSRTNDPRTAQQLSALFVMPIALLLLAQALGVVRLGPAMATAMLAGLLVVAAIVLRFAVRLFDRETILTRWK